MEEIVFSITLRFTASVGVLRRFQRIILLNNLEIFLSHLFIPRLFAIFKICKSFVKLNEIKVLEE